MLNENAKALVAALRSGEYTQTRGTLHRLVAAPAAYGEKVHPVGHCCLGVACEIFDQANPGVLTRKVDEGIESFAYTSAEGEPGVEAGSLPSLVQDWLGLTTGLGDYAGGGLYRDNDILGKTFAEIADIIESEPAGLFSE